MTIPIPHFDDAVVVRAEDAEVLGWSSVAIRLLADADDTGGALSVMRTTIAADTEGAKPHTHTRSAEMFYILDGQSEVLTGRRVLRATAGDLVVVPPTRSTRSARRRTAAPRSSSSRLPGSSASSTSGSSSG